MKKYFQILLLCNVLHHAFGESSLITLAIVQSIQNFFIKKSESFNFISYDYETGSINDFANKVVKAYYGSAFDFDKFPCRSIQVNDSNTDIEIDQSAVLMFDNVRSYQDFHARAIFTNQYVKDFHFLVYIRDFTGTNQESLVTKNPFGLFRYQSFLIADRKNSMKLTTFVTFQQPNCRDWIHIEVNRFSTMTKKWKSSKVFIEKFEDFNGCELLVGVTVEGQPITEVGFSRDGTMTSVFGYGVIIFDEISNRLNYASAYNAYFLDNQSFYSPTLRVDFLIMAVSLRIVSNSKALHFTYPFTTTEDVIVISRSELYTQFEKLFLPFEIEVWYWLIATLSMAVLTIFVLKFAPKYVRCFVYGRSVQTPILNLL